MFHEVRPATHLTAIMVAKIIYITCQGKKEKVS